MLYFVCAVVHSNVHPHLYEQCIGISEAYFNRFTVRLSFLRSVSSCVGCFEFGCQYWWTDSSTKCPVVCCVA